MASSADHQSTDSRPCPKLVGNAFVQQYYQILHQSPELVYRFYQDTSSLGRPEDDGIMCSVSTMDAINSKILSLDYGESIAELTTVDAQASHEGGVLVLVTGYLTKKDNITRKFTQTFFLAPQDKASYFVLNDIFRYADAGNEVYPGSNVDVQPPPTPENDVLAVQEDHISEQGTLSSEEAIEEVYIPSDNGEALVGEEDVLVPNVVDEIQDDKPLIIEPRSKIEDTPKKSYASIVKDTKESGMNVTNSTQVRVTPKEQQQVSIAPPPIAEAVEIVSHSNSVENGEIQEKVDGYSIYVKRLPMNATPAVLESEFKRFGTIKTNGIQVRSNKTQGFCFGFVEFETAEAVQTAIEEVQACPMVIGGHQIIVEEKRSTNTTGGGNGRGRFNGARGGGGMFRYDGGGRGRGGNYVRGGYGRDFGGGGGGRMEFANRNGGGGGGRGGYQNNRGGGDTYQRYDYVVSGGGRMNRGGMMNNGGSNGINGNRNNMANNSTPPPM